MVSAGDFRNGMTFDMDGDVFQIIEFQHVKPGKGAAFVRTKIRNVISGAVVDKTFNPTDKFPTAYIERRDMQYLYQDGDGDSFQDVYSPPHGKCGGKRVKGQRPLQGAGQRPAVFIFFTQKILCARQGTCKSSKSSGCCRLSPRGARPDISRFPLF